MQKKSRKSSSDTAFAEQLQRLAREQRALESSSIMPSWLGSINAMIANNALPFVVGLSFLLSWILFLVFFPLFLELGGLV